jgi:hypothetical protein
LERPAARMPAIRPLQIMVGTKITTPTQFSSVRVYGSLVPRSTRSIPGHVLARWAFAALLSIIH